MKDQSVVKGEIDLDTFFIRISPATVCFYFIAGCLGYSLPGQTSPVGQPFVENYFWKVSSVGRSCPLGLLLMSECAEGDPECGSIQ